MAQRCAAVAQSARPKPAGLQGRAGLRAAQHSGGRPKKGRPRAPKEKRSSLYRLDLLVFIDVGRDALL